MYYHPRPQTSSIVVWLFGQAFGGLQHQGVMYYTVALKDMK